MSEKLPFLGRSSEYDEKYCQMLIDHMGNGFSFESFAAVIGVCRASLYNWKNVHKAFLDAKNIGTDLNLHWWEKQGIEGLWEKKDAFTEKGMPYASKTINNTLWIFNMKNRHGWRDKTEEREIESYRIHKELSDEELDKKLEKK